MTRTHAGTMVAALSALLLAILDQTIVASAAAPIVGDLHGRGAASELPWLVAAYTLASTCVGPLYGKLADRLGARTVFIASLTLFLAGSALCAAAQTLGELIAFRAVQGLGGGGLMTLAMVVLGRLRAARERDAAGGGGGGGGGGNLYGAALVGIGLVLGPTLGGQIVAHASWRWVFAVNLPLGGAALVCAWRSIPRDAPPTGDGSRVDGLGAGLLAAVAASLLLACQWGAGPSGWTSARTLGCAAVALAALTAFVVRQLHARDPLVPLAIVSDRAVRVIALLQLLAGIGLAGGALYITLDLQLVHGISPAATGVRLLPMAAGLACGSVLGRRLLGDGAPLTAAIALGSLAAALAFGALAALGAGAPYAALAGLLWLLGAGIGVGLGIEVVVLQRIVDPAHLGIATAAVRFSEELGTSLAAAGMGVLFASRLGGATGAGGAGAGGMGAGGAGAGGAGASHAAAHAVAGAISPVFALAAIAMAVAAAAALRLPIAAAVGPPSGAESAPA